jgi:hypothetical protein
MRPGIFQIGRVRHMADGTTIVTGWGLSQCATGCLCHWHPVTGQLTIAEDQRDGLLGLVRYRPCDCCSPWTADELEAVLRDLAVTEAIRTVDPLTPET